MMRPILTEIIRIEIDGRMPLFQWHLENIGRAAHQLNYHWSVDKVQRFVASQLSRHESNQVHQLFLEVHDNGHMSANLLPIDDITKRSIALMPQQINARDSSLHFRSVTCPAHEAGKTWLHTQADLLDAIFCNQYNELTQGVRHHVYLKIAHTWYTPPLNSGVIPDAQRTALLDDEKVQERRLSIDDILLAQETRVSNSVHGWFTVNWNTNI